MSQAQQIINIDEEKRLTLNETILQEILMKDDIKDKSVCVISIAGAFRKGKSFFLNFLLRYLLVKYKLKINESNWLRAQDGLIEGFSWKHGPDSHTVGILIWPEIFLATLPDGEEIAIVLLDTQGSFDTDTEIAKCGTIFALSTLISSLQIYNLMLNIEQSDLSHLQYFSGYGQMIISDGDEPQLINAHPFQSLLFLIRDWRFPRHFNFGAEGGEEYLFSKVLGTNETLPPEVIALRANILELFNDVKCFLLPSPGKKVATTEKFEGDLNDIDQTFKNHVENLVTSILSPKNLIPKMINGEKIKVGDLPRFIKNYWESFQDKNLPPLQSIFTATADAHHGIALTEAIAIYENSMSFIKDENESALEENELEEVHESSKLKAFESFRNKKKMGSTKVSGRYEQKLEEKLAEKKLEYQKFNKIKLANEHGVLGFFKDKFCQEVVKASLIVFPPVASTASVLYVTYAGGLEIATCALCGLGAAAAGVVAGPLLGILILAVPYKIYKWQKHNSTNKKYQPLVSE